MAEDSAASRLRLSSARRRIDAFIEQIDVLAASSFPHDDGKEALAAIRKHCTRLRADAELPSGVREELVDRQCLMLLDKVGNFTEILGFILRSTNVRNPFELHYVVKKLVRQALGEEVSLLISSEWAYVPFTYPMSVDQLPEAILIGTPAPESGNPLLIPLAGHEVGHSAWRVYACTPLYENTASEMVKIQLEESPNARRKLLDAAPLGELEEDRVINECADHVMKQLEEVFCDLFGLYLFGHAFVAAFDYLMGPGGHDRHLDYPSDGQRMSIMAKAAEILEIALDQTMLERWTSASPRHHDRSTAEIVDAVVLKMIPKVQADLFLNLKGRGLKVPNSTNVERVREAFARGEPCPERIELGEIISAGWLRLLELDDIEFDHEDEENNRLKRDKSYKVLADLVLKTVEVAEYQDRTTSNA